MKKLLSVALIASYSIFAIANTTIITPKHSATCTGSKNCNACKNCKYCKHCSKDGGKCGVCK